MTDVNDEAAVEQARALRAAVAGDRLEALHLIAVGCSLRRGEIPGLSWSDVELEGRLLHVGLALARVDGEPTLVEPNAHSEPKHFRKQQVLGSNPSVGSSDLQSEASREAGFLRVRPRKTHVGDAGEHHGGILTSQML